MYFSTCRTLADSLGLRSTSTIVMCGSVKDTGCGQGILDSSQSHGFLKLGQLLILYNYTGT